MDSSLLQEAVQLLQKDFDLPAVQSELTEEQLVILFTPLLQHLLNRDFERLLQICYKIDLGENTFKQILHESEPNEMASDLARAIIARHKLKIEIRRKYSGG